MKLVIQFYADVSESSTNLMLDWINQRIFDAKKNGSSIDELIIQIASYGGSADRGILVYNTLRKLKIPITTVGMSNVDSAAISIFCAGDKRYAMHSCRFLIHETTLPVATDLDDSKLNEMIQVGKIINSESARIVAKTCANKRAKIQAIRQNMRKSIVWDTAQAKKKGLVQDFADEKSFYDINLEDIKMYFIPNPQESSSGQQKIKK